MNVKQFWQENKKGNRVPLVLMFEEYFLFGVLPETDTKRYYIDLEYRHASEKEFNNLAEQEIGIRPFNENKLIYMKGALEVRLGAKRVVDSGETAWIHPTVHSREELSEWIETYEKTDLRNNAVPETWANEGDLFTDKTGIPVTYLPSTTGPVTMAAAIVGTTELCMWCMDDPGLMKSFFTVLCQKQIEFIEGNQLRENGEIFRTGIGINDDSCCLFSPLMYEQFIAPYLEKLFSVFAPDPEGKRRQHSDSAMGHLMPILREFGVNEVNLGPSIHPAEIREAMPDAMIHGQMPPMTLRNGTEDEIRAVVQRDFDALGYDKFAESTSGVMSAGTSWENIRLYMKAVEDITSC